ncbi:MAG: DUF1329 domain-containing protein [Candidatus Binatus sp.]|uniref:DUF1329 domain-containing protein n=1 Tax=Candidatus Binatus sp. TaxID=2811406 RepID=UPI003C70FDED
MAKHALGKILLGVGMLMLLCLFVASANATVKPGDVITPENAAQVKDLVSPGVYYAVTHGMHMDIVPTDRIDWPPPYREATEKYSTQVRLTNDHRSLLGYVAGQPFPLIDPNDPYVATKIVWNNVWRPITTDDYDLRFFDCQSEYVRPGQDQNVVLDLEIGHYAGYNLFGRTEVEPMPVDPDFKQSGRLWLFGLYPFLAPEAQRGQGLIRYRYEDPNRGDDTWDWQPGTRRVRRLNEAINSSATGAQTFDADHFAGFNPKTEQYNYKFLGERQMLASAHAQHSPEDTCPYDGGATACPEAWELRHIYIVEATPRRDLGEAGSALDKFTDIYVDTELTYEPYIDTYDQKGHLWRAHIYWLAYRDRPVPDARVAIYPFKREFVVGSASIDTQGNYSSMCYLPGQHTPERECWYINMGAVDKDFISVKAMVASAP